MPVFSIILPVYNVSMDIVETLDSIMNQSFGDFECIIVDEFSTDSTGYCAFELYCRKDKRFKLFVNCINEEEHIYGALNYGLEQAKGKYIMPISAGDVLLPNALSDMNDFMESNSNCDGVCLLGKKLDTDPETGIKSVGGDIVYGKVAFNDNPARSSLNDIYAWNSHCYCIRKNAYDIKLPRFEFDDLPHYAYLWELLAAGFELQVCDKIGVNVSIIPDDRITVDAAHNKLFQKTLAVYKWTYYSKMKPDTVVFTEDNGEKITAHRAASIFYNTVQYFK